MSGWRADDESSGGEELVTGISNKSQDRGVVDGAMEVRRESGWSQEVKCFKCKKEGHKSTECEYPDKSKYSYEVYLLPRERMVHETFFPGTENSTAVDTYQEDADNIKKAFEKALEHNPTYNSVEKCLNKELRVEKPTGPITSDRLIDCMKISIRSCLSSSVRSCDLIEVGHNFHLMVKGVWGVRRDTRAIHMKTKRVPIPKSLQGLSAAKIAQTLMDQGSYQEADADKLKLPDKLKNVVKNYL